MKHLPCHSELHHTRGAPIPPDVLPLHGTDVGRDYLPAASPGSEPGSLTWQLWYATATPLSQCCSMLAGRPAHRRWQRAERHQPSQSDRPCSSVAPNFPSACYLPTSRLPQVCHHAQACQFHGAGEEHVPLTPIYMVPMASPELPRDEETEEAEAEDEAEAGVRKSCTRSQSSGPSPFWNRLSN